MSGHPPKDPAAPIPLDEARKRKASRSAKAPSAPAPPGDRRPVIRLEAGQLEPVVNEAEQALVDAGRGIYQRANVLVGIGVAPTITADRRRVETRQILPIGEHRLLELISSAAHFERWDGRAGGYVPVNVPMYVIKALEQRRGLYRFPPLSGLVNAPTLRADGSILAEPGYDAATGLSIRSR